MRRWHSVENFDCGREELNRYLVRFAWQNQQAGAAQTYVGIVGEAIVGYHTLAVGHVMLEDAPERLTKVLQNIRCPSCFSRGLPLIAGGKARYRQGVTEGRDAAHIASG
jgi:hypothetical protein